MKLRNMLQGFSIPHFFKPQLGVPRYHAGGKNHILIIERFASRKELTPQNFLSVGFYLVRFRACPLHCC